MGLNPKLPFQHVSKAVRKRNPHLYGPMAGLPSTERECDDVGGSQPSHGHEEKGKGRVVVGIISLRHRLLDDDNLTFGCKWLRDSIAHTLGIDDGDKRIRFEVSQVETKGQQGTVVRIDIVRQLREEAK